MIDYDKELKSLNDWLGQPENEGTKLSTYIPVNNRKDASASKSGVTIGKGFDLGTIDLDTLIDTGMSVRSIISLSPFIGLKGTKAWDKLKEEGKVTISEEDLEKLSVAQGRPVLSKLVSEFGEKTWKSLSDGAKKVAYAAATQYGSKFYKQKAFKQIKSGDLEGLMNNLSNWGDKTKGTGKAINERYSRYTSLNFNAPVVEGNVEDEVVSSIQSQIKEQGGLEKGEEVRGNLTAEESKRLEELEAKYGDLLPSSNEVGTVKESRLTEEEEARLKELEEKYNLGEEYKGPAYEEKPKVKTDFEIASDLYL